MKLYHVPFKGAGEATLGLLSRTVDLVLASTPSGMANLTAGTVRGLAVCGVARVAALPTVPTFAEAGVRGFEMINWTGLVAPAGTPEAVVLRLQQAVRQALAEARMAQFFAAQGATPGGTDPAEFSALIRREVVSWQTVTQRAGIQPQ